MKRKRLWGTLLALLLLASVAAWFTLQMMKGPVPEGMPTSPPEGSEWLDLLDAAHAPNWENVTNDKDIFEIKDGVLHIYGRMNPPLRYVGYTADTFGDFELHIECKLAPRANSGIFLRVPVGESTLRGFQGFSLFVHKETALRGFEVQVLDDYGTSPNKNGSGSIYDVVTPMFNMARPAGEWNSYDIRVHAREVVVIMNGWMVVHTDFDKMIKPLGKFGTPYAQMPLEGNFVLQDHGHEVWYRNILIKKTAQAAAPPQK